MEVGISYDKNISGYSLVWKKSNGLQKVWSQTHRTPLGRIETLDRKQSPSPDISALVSSFCFHVPISRGNTFQKSGSCYRAEVFSERLTAGQLFHTASKPFLHGHHTGVLSSDPSQNRRRILRNAIERCSIQWFWPQLFIRRGFPHTSFVSGMSIWWI